MSENRPAIPRPMMRDVKTEAGHRCAIPTCRMTSGLEIHHIEDYSKVREHTFDNLILLCAVCHARATKGDIDRKSMRAYKANLSVVNQRYGDLERRVLEMFATVPEGEVLQLPGGQDVHLWYLCRDGLLEKDKDFRAPTMVVDGIPNVEYYRLTESGREFLEKWVDADRLERTTESDEE